jgi:RNA polymerase sigma-70 factor (ECF subfamily)
MRRLVGVSLDPDSLAVRRCLEGDKSAFDELVARHGTRLFNLISRTLGSKEEAHDVFCEAFTNAYCALKSFQLGRSFWSWLAKIACNLCVDHMRRNRRPSLSLDGEELAGFEPPDTGARVDEIAQAWLDQETIERAVASLPDVYRMVVVLRHMEEMSISEISSLLDLPEGTVKVRLFRARDLLRGKLGSLAVESAG